MKLFLRSSCLLSLLLIVAYSNSAQALNSDEKKIVEYIDKNNTQAVSLIEKMVNMESPTEDLAGVKSVGALFAKEFESLGMTVKWLDMPAEMKRAGHLVAESNGSKGKRILLLGHIDTVLKGERFRIEGKKAYGTGIADMVGGNVILLQALKALNASGLLKDRQIMVMLTGDEESTGEPESVSRGPMRDLAKRSDAALSFEAAVLNTATVGRRGWSSWTLEVEAKTGHSGQIFKPGMGDGAIFETSRILNEFREKLSKEKYLSFNPSMIVGGTTAATTDVSGTATGKLNVVPAKVIVNGDLRFISNEQRAAARKTMSEIVARNLPGTTAKITFKDGNPAMAPVEGNYALLKQLDQVSRDLGFGEMVALDPGERGAGDIGYISDLVPSLDGIGIGGPERSHAKGEAAALDTIPVQTKRAALLIYRLTR
ncbi:MAG: M20/M25/M40 family metallo-hydrolase [Pyrinomonadaceae bacterium]|nr:M20/M25/M40 family metallo-hydrolase [Acidobacteriota bacterium]MBP7377014.1 M20/M25/M40 family metallo-hydrolase [Pyrinomonadaceae bacterium]